MRHVAVRLMGVALTVACFATPAFAASNSSLAPADEYFGRFHMSVLGIRNAIHDFGSRITNDPNHAGAMLGSISLTEDAIRDWSTRYPKDPLFPKTLLQLERLYVNIGGADALERAQNTVTWFDTMLPNDPYTKMAHTLVTQPSDRSDDSMPSGPVSDDGTPITADSPATLGVVPGVVPGAVLPPDASVKTATAKDDSLPSYASRPIPIDDGATNTETYGPSHSATEAEVYAP